MLDNEPFEGHQWTSWYRLDDQEAKQKIPDKPGVYEIRVGYKFGRLKGESQILSIGRAIPSLRNRLSGGRLSNLVRNLDRPEKWLFNTGKMIWFRYVVTPTSEDAKWLEALRQWEYENEHWELPPGNDRLEKAAVFRRVEQRYGRLDERSFKELLQQHKTTEKLANVLGIPPVIIDNLKIYWMV